MRSEMKSAIAQRFQQLKHLGLQDMLPAFCIKSAASIVVLMDFSGCCLEEKEQISVATGLVTCLSQGSAWQLTCTFPS